MNKICDSETSDTLLLDFPSGKGLLDIWYQNGKPTKNKHISLRVVRPPFHLEKEFGPFFP